MIQSLSSLTSLLLPGPFTAGVGEKATMIGQTQCQWTCRHLSYFVSLSSSIGIKKGEVALAASNSQDIFTMAIGCCSIRAFAVVSISSRRSQITIFTLVEAGRRYILRPKNREWQKRGRYRTFATVHLCGATDGSQR